MAKSPITCHVLDASLGKPAQGIYIRLQQLEKSENGGPEVYQPLAKGTTNEDGRCIDLLPVRGSEEEQREKTALVGGSIYKIVFKTEEYFESTNRKSFYPHVEITFKIENPEEHYHIPLLISPYSYTTYRGS